MSPFRLAVWTSIGVNYSTYKILERYMLKFSKGASSVAELHKDDLGLLDPTQETQRATWFRPAVRPAAAAETGSRDGRGRRSFLVKKDYWQCAQVCARYWRARRSGIAHV